MPELSLETAKAIVVKAVEYGGLDKSELENATDETYLARSKEVLEIVEQADLSGSINESVLEVLHAAGIAPQSEQTTAAYNQRFGSTAASNGSTQTSPAPSEAQGPDSREQASPGPVGSEADSLPVSDEPAREAAPAEEIDISSIFPGYDDQKVADIKKAILFSCADGSMTAEEWEQIKAYEAAHEERKTILSLKPEFKAPEPEPVPDPAPVTTGAFAQPTTSTTSVSQFTLAGGEGGAGTPLQSDNGDSITAFYNGETISRAHQEGLPIPPQTTDEGVVMPIDITGIPDPQLSELATRFHSSFARTEWLLSQETNRATAAEHIEHESHRDAYIRAYEMHKSAIPEEKRGPTALDAARKLAEKDADDAAKVREFRSKKIRHQMDANELKALARVYDRSVWRITDELQRRGMVAKNSFAAK
jgi:hypothetical protein